MALYSNSTAHAGLEQRLLVEEGQQYITAPRWEQTRLWTEHVGPKMGASHVCLGWEHIEVGQYQQATGTNITMSATWSVAPASPARRGKVVAPMRLFLVFTRLITMRSKPDCVEVAFLLLLFFSLVLLIFLSLDKCHCDSQHLLKMVPGNYL